MSEDRKNTHLVVVGSSAGGIEALSTLVSTLPEGLNAPVVIAQHLHPERESRLPEILGRRSSLPVRTVVDHDHLDPGVVYVIPSNRHVNVTPSEIDLQANTRGRPKPSVDMLMSSAAGVFGEGLIAVVLTGTGSDGAEGARAVRQAGGTVIIQDPETAEFGGMPGSLAPNTVDIVADLERVGPIVGELLGGVLVEEEEAEGASLQHFLEGLKERHGVDFTSYKTPTILRRLKRRMVATDTATIEDYALYLEDQPEELPQLVNTLLIKVTQFFRNPDLFAHLREEVLPGLVEEARKEDRQLRIWSAGCATGEEAYTLAIMLSELLGSEAALADVRIFATDIDREAVNFARRGVYPAGALSGISEEQRERYFVEEDGHYEVKKPVRGMIVFGEHDLARRSPFPRIDLVVSRNVLIYFTAELQRRALALFAFSLRNGGYLVLGKAETASTMPESFASELRQHKVYRREGERLPLPGTSPVPTPLARQPRVAPGGGFSAGVQPPGRRPRTTDEGILNRLPVGLVVVDRRYDILDLNAAARTLLSIRGAAVGEDLLHAVQSIPYAGVRDAIDSAFRDGVSTTGEFSVEEATGEPRYLTLACHPQRGRDRKGLAETVAIVVNDVTDIGKERRGLQERLEGSEAEKSRLEAQNGRLIESNRRLEEANGELTALNDTMQASYEDALLAAEEAQAATEEVETLNEEMQATNEELETLKDVTEFREARRVIEERERRYRTLTTNIPGAVFRCVHHDGRLTMEFVSRRIEEITGRPAADFIDDNVLNYADVIHPEDRPKNEREVRRALEEHAPYNIEYRLLHTDGGLRWVNERGSSIFSRGGDLKWVDGAIFDITERRRAEEALRKSAVRAAFRAELTEALRPLADPAEIKAEASRVLGQHLEANRVIYGEISLDDWIYVGGSEYLDGAGSIAGRLDLDDYDPALLENFRAGRTVVALDLSNDADLTAVRLATFEAAQVRAHVSVPLVKNGRLVAALGVNQTSPRAWTAEEIALVEETAERTWAAVERARAEEALRRSEERYRTLFEKIDEGFCIIDVVFDEAHSPTDYRFVETNPAFERMTGLERAVGRTARELVPDLEEWWFETYGRVASTGEAIHFENHSEAMGRWFEVRASRIGGQESRKVALVFDDITERKRAAEERDRLLAREWVAVAEAAERERISRELHDRVAHSMGVAHQSLELHDVLAGEDAARAGAKLDLAREMIKASLESTRNLSAELRRLDAEDGLEAELRHLLDVSVPPGIRADIRVDGDEADVPGHVRGQLFLMLREAVRNAVSHSGCGSLSIGLDITPERIVGSVEDDGQGFDNDAGNGGVGLRSMRERAALLDGDLELDCEPGRGTRVELCVPLMEGR